MTVAVGDQRRERFDLLLRFQHRLVGAVEIVEMADQRVDARATSNGSSM